MSEKEKNTEDSSLWHNLSQKFYKMDEDLSARKNEVLTWQWLSYAIVIAGGVVSIAIVNWYIILLAAAAMVTYNVIVTLAVEKPKVLKVPSYNQESFLDIFHFSAKSKRILFLAIPLLILALAIPAYGNPFFAWTVIFVLLLPMRTLMQYSKWPKEKKYDKDYIAFSVACIGGIACLLLSLPIFHSDIQANIDNTNHVANNSENQNKNTASNSTDTVDEKNQNTNNSSSETINAGNNAIENNNVAKLENTNADSKIVNTQLIDLQKVLLEKLTNIENKISALPSNQTTVVQDDSKWLEEKKLLEEQISGMKKSLLSYEEVKKQLSSLKQEKALLESSKNTALNDKKLLEDKLKNSQEQTSEVIQENNALKLMEKAQQVRIQNLERENKELKPAQELYDSSLKKIAILEKENGALKLLADAQKSSDDEATKLQELLATIKEEKNALFEKNQSLSAEIANIKEQISSQSTVALEKKLEDLEAEKHSLQLKFNSLNIENQALKLQQQNSSDIEKQVSQLQANIKNIEGEKTKLEEKINSLNRENMALKLEQQNANDYNKQQIIKLEAEKESTNQKLKELETSKAAVELQLSDIQEKAKQMSEEFEKTEEKFFALEKENNDLKAKIAELEQAQK